MASTHKDEDHSKTHDAPEHKGTLADHAKPGPAGHVVSSDPPKGVDGPQPPKQAGKDDIPATGGPGTPHK